MSLNYRPTSFSGGGIRGDVTPATGTNELSHAGLSAGAEAQLSGCPADIGKAHTFFAAAGAETHAIGVAAVAPGAESALMHMPLVPGASEPISPLIQLIMRMPGQIGLFSSFFEALGNFFLPHLHMLGLDPSILDIHAHVASLSTTHLPGLDHGAISSHLLPGDAPIFHAPFADGSTGLTGMNGMHDLGGMIGKDSFVTHSDVLNPRGILKISGGLNDMSRVQFEGAPSGLGSSQPSELLSGPSLSDNPVATHLAGTQRLFGDRIQGTFFAKQGMQASMAAGPSPLPQGLQSHGAALPSSLNVGASTLGSQPSAPPVMANDAGTTSAAMPAAHGTDGGSLGPSGPIDHLGDAKQLIAANPGAESFRPSLGNQGPDYGASYLNSQPVDITPHGAAPHGAAANADHASALKPLKAKELSLDSVDGAGHHQVMDRIGHQSKAGAEHSHVSNARDQIAHQPAHHAYQTQPGHAASHAPSHPSTSGSPTKIASTPGVKPATHAVSPSPSHAHASAEDATDASGSAPDQTGDQTADQAGDQSADAADATSDYTIKSGDNLWNIAKDHMGSGLKWHEIYNMNKDVLGSNPDLIFSGVKLKLPGGDLAGAGADASKYVVKSGDCLWNIAKDQMHDASKWSELYKANADVIGSNPRLIMPGQELTLPGHESATTVADGSSVSGSGDGAAAEATAPSEQVAQTATSAPQATSTSASSSFGAPATTDGAAAAPTAPAAPEAAPAMEVHPQPGALQQAVPNLPSVPGAAMAAPASPFGGSAAGAATLHVMPLTQPMHLEATAAGAQPSVVNSTIGTDLATFLGKRK